MQSASPILIDLQLAFTEPAFTGKEASGLPTAEDFQRWAQAALQEAGHDPAQAVEITVRLVDAEESQTLNREYRDKDKPTNVLSFPSELPDFLREQLDELPLGDLVICVPVVAAEAVEQGKAERDHWAHLTIHGVLHLLGYDHIDDEEAEVMEGKEITALHDLGIANPYE